MLEVGGLQCMDGIENIVPGVNSMGMHSTHKHLGWWEFVLLLISIGDDGTQYD